MIDNQRDKALLKERKPRENTRAEHRSSQQEHSLAQRDRPLLLRDDSGALSSACADFPGDGASAACCAGDAGRLAPPSPRRFFWEGSGAAAARAKAMAESMKLPWLTPPDGCLGNVLC